MKISPWLMLLILMGCGGSLSDEQRRDMRQKMEESKIVRITEVEITEAAYAEGRDIIKTMDSLAAEPDRLQSFVDSRKGSIRFITPDQSNVHLLEKQLIDAYLASDSPDFQDNVQKLRNAQGDFDSLLYTKPVTTKHSDGSDQLEGVWNIWLPKKDLVMEMAKRK